MQLPDLPIAPHDTLEWDLQFDMQERGRRLREFAKATEGKELVEVKPGQWRYVPVLDGSQLPGAA